MEKARSARGVGGLGGGVMGCSQSVAEVCRERGRLGKGRAGMDQSLEEACTFPEGWGHRIARQMAS